MAPPKGSWDSHVHVLDPVRPSSNDTILIDKEEMPFAKSRPFTPKAALLSSLESFESSNGIDHVCIVQVSSYATNNMYMVRALRQIAQQGGIPRGVVVIDPAQITDEELDMYHEAGVRAVRVNMKTYSISVDPKQWKSLLMPYVLRIKRLDWVLQIYVSLDALISLAPIIPQLGITVVIDHIAHAGTTSPCDPNSGFAELLNLLRRKEAFVKVSGLNRLTDDPQFKDIGTRCTANH